MTEQQWPSMSGWRKREMLAKQRADHKNRMAEVREARRLNRMREAGMDMEEAEVPRETPTGASEHESATVSPDYPDPEQMNREDLFAYLKSHGVTPGPATKDGTLRRKVAEVRDRTGEQDGEGLSD